MSAPPDALPDARRAALPDARRGVPPVDPRLSAVILTGGTGRRLGGADKAMLRLGASTLLERALAAASRCGEVVVVGTPVPTPRPVVWTREEPPGGGPAAGLLAGLDALSDAPEMLLALAVDMPLVTAGTVDRLASAARAAPDSDGAVLCDDDGHPQTLAGVYRLSALRRARPSPGPPGMFPEPGASRPRGTANGLSMRSLIAGLRLVEVPAIGGEAQDVDTWADLEALTP